MKKMAGRAGSENENNSSEKLILVEMQIILVKNNSAEIQKILVKIEIILVGKI